MVAAAMVVGCGTKSPSSKQTSVSIQATGSPHSIYQYHVLIVRPGRTVITNPITKIPAVQVDATTLVGSVALPWAKSVRVPPGSYVAVTVEWDASAPASFQCEIRSGSRVLPTGQQTAESSVIHEDLAGGGSRTVHRTWLAATCTTRV
jgi:hypothetical protein